MSNTIKPKFPHSKIPCRIILVGFMGTGKTEFGKRLSGRLGMSFVDCDARIERLEGMSIRRIFERKGEPYFRRIERECLKKALKRKNAVISTGGGIVLRSANRGLLKRSGFVVWMKSSPEVIYKRVRGLNSRPLLNVGDPLAEIRARMRARKPFYAEVARTAVWNENKTLSETLNGFLKRRPWRTKSK